MSNSVCGSETFTSFAAMQECYAAHPQVSATDTAEVAALEKKCKTVTNSYEHCLCSCALICYEPTTKTTTIGGGPSSENA